MTILQRCKSIILKKKLFKKIIQLKYFIHNLCRPNVFISILPYKMKLSENLSLPCSTPILSIHSLIPYNLTMYSLFYPSQSGFCFPQVTELLIKITNVGSLPLWPYFLKFPYWLLFYYYIESSAFFCLSLLFLLGILSHSLK